MYKYYAFPFHPEIIHTISEVNNIRHFKKSLLKVVMDIESYHTLCKKKNKRKRGFFQYFLNLKFYIFPPWIHEN